MSKGISISSYCESTKVEAGIYKTQNDSWLIKKLCCAYSREQYSQVENLIYRESSQSQEDAM